MTDTDILSSRENLPPLRAFSVCVDYWDYLDVCATYNRHHFSEWVVVTAPHDYMTRDVCHDHDIKTHTTDAFYRNGAHFNKWLALEEAMNLFGRDGWLVLLDVDVLWPRVLPEFPLEVGKLYSPFRRMKTHVGDMIKGGEVYFPDEKEWINYPVHRNIGEHAGYTQIFHGSDPVLGPAPWHGVDWTHAGSADSFFQRKWSPGNKVRPPFEVLHLGESGQNWYGRATPYLDGTTPMDGRTKIKKLLEMWKIRKKTGSFDHEKIKKGE